MMADALARKLIAIKRNGDEWMFKWSKGGEIYTLKADERANPELPAAMDDLLPYALEAAHYVDPKVHRQTIVAGVDFDWKGNESRRNAVVLLSIDCGAQGYVKLPTPKKLADNALDEKKKGRWETNAVAQFDKIEQEALAYIDGTRSQQSLPMMPTKKGKQSAANLDQESFGNA